ncbi:hypothetical protein B9T19_07990 [Ignatzschineria sp. F8392]|nr:hypothetical protein [Ignatzschineria sp. F8392]OYQ78772.1 hypothetical protein B9T19_07990 [Ignatzschineria sp. F8392]
MIKTKKVDELPILTIVCFSKSRAGKYRYFNNITPGIIDANLRACSRDKNEIVLSRLSTSPLMESNIKNRVGKIREI